MMRRSHRISAKVTRAIVSAAILIALPGGQRALAQPMHSRGGQVIVPDSSVEQPNDIGVRAHTNVSYFVPTGGMRGVHPPSLEAGARSGAPANGDYWAETPASLACVYNLASQSNGCNPYAVGAVPAGGSKAIAIVDAYHDATALSDLQMFSTQFGLPAPNLQVIFASGTPPTNSGWNLEEALDTEWAHAMAPNATIYLVEAMSNSLSDLFTAVSKASSLVVAAGGGQVSMSWGTSEFSSETNYDFVLRGKQGRLFRFGRRQCGRDLAVSFAKRRLRRGHGEQPRRERRERRELRGSSRVAINRRWTERLRKAAVLSERFRLFQQGHTGRFRRRRS